MNMAEKIRNCRRKMDLTQPELADLVGVSPMTVRRWEWNERTPNASLIPKLAEVLNTSIEYLIKDTSEPEPESPCENQNQNEIKNPSYINMKEAEDDLDLGYWGAMAQKAERVARCEDTGKKFLIGALLRAATEAVTGSTTEMQNTGKINNVHDNDITHSTFKF